MSNHIPTFSKIGLNFPTFNLFSSVDNATNYNKGRMDLSKAIKALLFGWKMRVNVNVKRLPLSFVSYFSVSFPHKFSINFHRPDFPIGISNKNTQKYSFLWIRIEMDHSVWTGRERWHRTKIHKSILYRSWYRPVLLWQIKLNLTMDSFFLN